MEKPGPCHRRPLASVAGAVRDLTPKYWLGWYVPHRKVALCSAVRICGLGFGGCC